MLQFKRGKRKLISDVTSKDIYKFYTNKYKNTDVSYSTFISVFKRFIELRLQMVIFENVEFHMPHRLGSLRVKIGGNAFKITKEGKPKIIPNWGETKKLWAEQYPDKTPEEISEIKDKQLVYILNDHTDGKVFHWHWDKWSCNFKNKTVYYIQMNRKWKIMLKNYINKSKKIEYYG